MNSVNGRPVWTWSDGDEGYRKPGAKGKGARKLYHKAIQRGSERLNVGDCAHFVSICKEDRPFVGKVETLWEANGRMMVNVKWFYHPEEVKINGKGIDLKVPVSSCY